MTANVKLKQLWMTAAGICIIAAAVFLLRGHFNAAFVVAVLGLVSWFLNYRSQVQEELTAEDLRHDNDQEGDDDSDENEPSEV